MRLKLKYLSFKNCCMVLMAGAGLWLTSIISSCGKGPQNEAINLNIRYQVLNLSPDVFPLDIYFNYIKANPGHLTFGVNQGYFNVPSLVSPSYVRSSDIRVDTPLFKLTDTLKRNVQYSLFITGDVANNSINTIFTVDTATLPKVGRGKVRFVDASPSGAAGLDVYANNSKAFSKILYPKYSGFVELPNGYYDFTITAAGSSTVLKTVTNYQIEDGRLYTLYTYGYTNRTDSAAFNAAFITNR
ncbi:MAG: DUF4397 domain-containing protein [Bacteroidota bacterium]